MLNAECSKPNPCLKEGRGVFGFLAIRGQLGLWRLETKTPAWKAGVNSAIESEGLFYQIDDRFINDLLG